MIQRALLCTLLLLLAIGGSLGTACGADAPRKPMSVIIAVPANRSPAFQRQFTHDLGLLYTDVIPGDQVTVINASTLQVVEQVTIPADLGESDNERDNALEESFAPIFRFANTSDSNEDMDNVHIPALEREIGHNVMPTIDARPVNVIVIGSIQWDEPRDATWNFHQYFPSDFFLLQRGGSFGLAGDESSLTGTRVSILYTDKKSDFPWDGFRNDVIDFWRKSIKGRGGSIGEVAAYGEGSYQHFFATTEDTRAATINVTAPMVLYAPGSVNVPVDRLGANPLPPEKGQNNAHLDRRFSRRHGHNSHSSGTGGGAGHNRNGAGSVSG